MKRFTANSKMAQSVKALEDLMDEFGITMSVTPHGIMFDMDGMRAVYLDIEGEETTRFPHPFETKLIERNSYMEG